MVGVFRIDGTRYQDQLSSGKVRKGYVTYGTDREFARVMPQIPTNTEIHRPTTIAFSSYVKTRGLVEVLPLPPTAAQTLLALHNCINNQFEIQDILNICGSYDQRLINEDCRQIVGWQN